MEEQAPREDATPPLKRPAKTLALRGQPRPVVRFRKGLIVGLTGTLSAAVIAVTWFALEPGSLRLTASDEPARIPARAPPDALSGAPATYGDVPKLGPPLPGDLGRPILERQRELAVTSPDLAVAGAAPIDAMAAERERRRSEDAAARSSALKVGLSASPALSSQGSAEPPIIAPSARAEGPKDGPLVAATSPHTLLAGAIIPASLVTGLNSALPGLIVAQVTENVRDSVTGTEILIPQGARLIGKYDDAIAYGQKRALVTWQRMILPNGSSIALGDMPATDAAGYAGLRDRVDAHGWEIVKGAALATLFNVGSELRLDGGGPLVRAVREATQQSVTDAGDQLISKELNVRPTLTVRPGFPVRVLVTRDLVLEPWRG